MRIFDALLTLTVATSCLSQASPITVSNGSNVTITFDGSGGDPVTLISGLTASLQLTGFDFHSYSVGTHSGQTSVAFNYSMTNTSSSPILTSRVSAFGFNTTPNIVNTVDNVITGTYNGVLYDVNYPNTIGNVEFCITSQNCPGGGGGGVTQGNNGTGTALLYFTGTISGLTFDNSYDRYQSISYTGNNCVSSATGSGTPSGAVPEPASYVLISSGLIGLGSLSRRRKD